MTGNVSFADLTPINAKSWRKAEADATVFSHRGRSVSGKLGQLTANGFEVIDAGIKVFGEKVKEPTPETSNITSDAMPVSWSTG